MEVFLQALVNGILLGGFYSLMGMGQNIIFGVMNIVNFCHGEMLMVGMYITYVLYTYFGVDASWAFPSFPADVGRHYTCSQPIFAKNVKNAKFPKMRFFFVQSAYFPLEIRPALSD